MVTQTNTWGFFFVQNFKVRATACSRKQILTPHEKDFLSRFHCYIIDRTLSLCSVLDDPHPSNEEPNKRHHMELHCLIALR